MKMDNSGWHFQDLLIYLFGGLVHLYPPRFRAEFSDEIRAVLVKRMREAEERGTASWFAAAFREITQLVISILHECWHELRMRKEKTRKEIQMRTNRMLVLIGGVILVLGSRLPWMSVPVLFGVEGPTFEGIEIGWEDNGFITGGIGLILLLVGIFWRGRIGKRYSIPGAVLAALAVLVVIGCFYRILEIGPGAGFLAATDVGIYVTLIGAILALVGALYHTSVDQDRQGTTLLSSSM
jgi:hypothetical protein